MPGAVSPLRDIKALTFDVFGTTVDWRTSVTEELILRAYRKNTPESSVSPETKARLQSLNDHDWGRFAQEWRDSYQAFKLSFNPESSVWKTIDEHHRDSLVELLNKWHLSDLYTESEIDSLSFVWHRLKPWPDSSQGLTELAKLGLVNATLSNGNISLLTDLDEFGSLGFHKFFSAESFRAYKPNPVVYLSAARELGGEPGQVAMVATHLDDLKAAIGVGMRTIYVKRPQEEYLSESDPEYQKIKSQIDIWVESEDGFLEVVRQLKEIRQ